MMPPSPFTFIIGPYFGLGFILYSSVEWVITVGPFAIYREDVKKSEAGNWLTVKNEWANR